MDVAGAALAEVDGGEVRLQAASTKLPSTAANNAVKGPTARGHGAGSDTGGGKETDEATADVGMEGLPLTSDRGQRFREFLRKKYFVRSGAVDGMGDIAWMPLVGDALRPRGVSVETAMGQRRY